MSARGAQHTMPLLVINMGGEMVYILEQRLTAQNVAKDKASRVLQDVVKTMFSKKFTIELFKPQEMYTDAAMRAIFDKLAHSSIMRLNEASMTKLYSLMVMGFKHQILAASEPRHLLDITERHLRSLKPVCNAPDVDDLLDETFAMCSDLYSSFTYGDWMLLKSFLCDFYQNRKIRVSLFLASGIQSMDGTIALSNTGAVPMGGEAPGTIKYFERGEAVDMQARYSERERERETEREGRARARRARERVPRSRGEHDARAHALRAFLALSAGVHVGADGDGRLRGERDPRARRRGRPGLGVAARREPVLEGEHREGVAGVRGDAEGARDDARVPSLSLPRARAPERSSPTRPAPRRRTRTRRAPSRTARARARRASRARSARRRRRARRPRARR